MNSSCAFLDFRRWHFSSFEVVSPMTGSSSAPSAAVPSVGLVTWELWLLEGSEIAGEGLVWGTDVDKHTMVIPASFSQESGQSMNKTAEAVLCCHVFLSGIPIWVCRGILLHSLCRIWGFLLSCQGCWDWRGLSFSAHWWSWGLSRGDLILPYAAITCKSPLICTVMRES